jgi:hypothetical protein
MLNRLIEWSARNVFIVLLATGFIVAWGVYALVRTPVDAIPDLSDVQVIVYTEYPGQAPQVVEDQVTYPLTTAMLAVPKSKVVRGLSVFGASFVYIIFEDGTDIYWARSRVLEYLNYVSGRLPRGVSASLGPDATGVGWVYQYALLAKNRTLEELRTIQDWFVRYQLTKAQGVSEVASVGGFTKQYQVTVNPRLLQAFGVPLSQVMQVIRESNRDVGGRVVELTETEYVVRGRGYLRGMADIETLVLKAQGGTPVLVRDVARVEAVPEERRARRPGRGRRRHRGRALWAERAGRDPQPEEPHRRDLQRAAGRRVDPGGVRPLGAHRARHPDAQAHPDRGKPDRRAGVHRVSLPRAQRARRHPGAAGGRADRLHRHALARPQLQHHEPGGHRHRDRRDGGRGDRHDRERAQAP